MRKGDRNSVDAVRSETRTHKRSVESYVLSVFEVPLALMLAAAVMMAVAWAGCAVAANRCVDISGLPWYLGGAVLGRSWRRPIG